MACLTNIYDTKISLCQIEKLCEIEKRVLVKHETKKNHPSTKEIGELFIKIKKTRKNYASLF